MNKAVFLDLNGTLIPSVTYDEKIPFNLIIGADKAVAKLTKKGFVCPVVTIQSRIGKGIFTEKEFIKEFNTIAEKFKENGGGIQGPYLCPHDYGVVCRCRKPKPFLFEKAAQDFNLDLKGSYIIGDSICDVVSAINFGGYGCFLKSSKKKYSRSEIELISSNSAFIGNSIHEIVDWIIDRELKD